MKRAAFVLAGALVFALATVNGVSAQGSAEAVPTFAKDVAPILFDNCAVCHRPGEVAPMSLLTYQDARPWSRAIKEKVVSREMPPWLADRRFGSFRNERGLTQGELDTIVAWSDGGAPRGADADLPAAPQFASGWSHPSGRPPDVILEMPVEFEIPAEGETPNFSLYAKVPFEEDKFLEAIEMRPSNYAVVHHSGVYVRDLPPGAVVGRGEAWPGGPIVEAGAVIRTTDMTPEQLRTLNIDPEDLEVERQLSPQARRDREADDVFAVGGTSKMVSYVPGRGFEQFWPGIGKRLRAGMYLSWGMHYQSTGKPETDRSLLGLWFQQDVTHHEVLTQRVGQTHVVENRELLVEPAPGGRGPERARIPVIPPYDGDWAITGITTFTDDVTLYAMSPHMHLRGKDATYVVTYPDGREEVILSVPKYDFNWQLHYELQEPLKIPAGSTIKSVAHFDNSLQNRYNPAPQKEVYWAEQSWDEMFNSFIEYSIDKLDLTKVQPPTEEE